MRIHALRHLQFEGLGLIQPWIWNHGHSLTETHFWNPESKLPEMDSFDFLVVMGGSMNVDEEIEYPWLVAEKAFIGECIRQNKKILGICLGAQLIARATGRKVGRSPQKEIGWFPVEKKFEKHSLFPLFDHRKEIPMMHWHGDMFDIPTDAQALFSTKGCPNQGFSMNDNRVIGLQFHPELSDQHIRLFFEDENEEFVTAEQFIQTPEDILKESKHHVLLSRQVLYDLLDRMAESN